jgi:hypothetical protein
MGDNMKWIYGKLKNANDRPLSSYKINPNYIIAVDFNERELIVKDFETPLYYDEEDDYLILQLINGQTNE